MKLTTVRCFKCSNPVRPPNTTPFEGEYWLCSDDCYKEALNPFIPKNFQFGRHPMQDPEVQEYVEYMDTLNQDGHYDYRGCMLGSKYHTGQEVFGIQVRAYGREWYQKQKEAFAAAVPKLREHIKAEHAMLMEAEQAKQQLITEKEQLKEAERLAKKKVLDDAREAEEERWRPKDFTL